MKVNGKTITTLRTADVYLYTAEGPVKFTFRPLGPDETFDKVMPRPVAPLVKRPNQPDMRDAESPAFKASVDSWIDSKMHWEFLTSISATDGLEWDTVDISDPGTWKNYKNDLGKILSDNEIGELWNGFSSIQYITEEVMQKAREDFLTGTLARQAT